MSSQPEFGAPTWHRAMIAVAIIAVESALLLLLSDFFRPTDIDSIYLFTVFLVAIRWGRATAMMSAALAVGVFYYAFIPPRFSFSIDDPRDLVTIAVMASVAFISAELSSRIRAKALRAQSLYSSNRSIIKFIRQVHELNDPQEIVNHFISTTRNMTSLEAQFLEAEAVIDPRKLMPNEFKVDSNLMILSVQKRIPLLSNGLGLPDSSQLYLPLQFKNDVLGLFILRSVNGRKKAIAKADIDYCDALAQVTSARLVQVQAA